MIPLHVPLLEGNELQYLAKCIDSGWISPSGPLVEEFERAFARCCGVQYAVATASGTSALHLALLCLGVGDGDFVIAPNLTFVATANAIQYTGARPLFVDVDEHTWQLDLDLLEQFLVTRCHRDGNVLRLNSNRARIRAVVPVHVMGGCANLGRLEEIGSRFALQIVEDASEAVGTKFDGRSVGSFGAMGVFSFNGNKIVSTGGGGMLVTEDSRLATRAHHLSTQAKLGTGNYLHDEVGYNYRMSSLAAAVGLAQLEQLPEILRRKQENAMAYQERLSQVPGIRFQQTERMATPNAWLNCIGTRSASGLKSWLTSRQIECRGIWSPMNSLPMYRTAPYVQVNDNSLRISNEALCLPSSASLTRDQIEVIATAIEDFFAGGALS